LNLALFLRRGGVVSARRLRVERNCNRGVRHRRASRLFYGKQVMNWVPHRSCVLWRLLPPFRKGGERIGHPSAYVLCCSPWK
jgi:hypothetical protein